MTSDDDIGAARLCFMVEAAMASCLVQESQVILNAMMQSLAVKSESGSPSSW